MSQRGPWRNCSEAAQLGLRSTQQGAQAQGGAAGEVQQPLGAATGASPAPALTVAVAAEAGQQALPTSSTEACSTAAGLETLVQECSGAPSTDTSCQPDQQRCPTCLRSSSPAAVGMKREGGGCGRGKGQQERLVLQGEASRASGESSSSAAALERDC